MTFKNYSINDLVNWRNSASNRVSENEKMIACYMIKAEKLDKKISKDLTWIKALNRELSKRVFPKKG